MRSLTEGGPVNIGHRDRSAWETVGNSRVKSTMTSPSLLRVQARERVNHGRDRLFDGEKEEEEVVIYDASTHKSRLSEYKALQMRAFITFARAHTPTHKHTH